LSFSQFDPNFDPAAKRAAGGLKWNRYDPDVLPAWIAETDFAPPAEIINALEQVTTAALFGYTSREDRLLEACLGWMKRRHDWTIDPTHVLMFGDVMQGVEAAVTAFSEPGDGVILTTPVYFPFFAVPRTAGRRQVEWPLRRDADGWRFHTDDLERILDSDPGVRVILLSHPHNPTGRVMDPATMNEVVSLASSHNVMIVSDEIHADLIYPGTDFQSMLTADNAADRVVVSTSPAKTFAISGLRSSVLVFGSPQVKHRVRDAHPQILLGQINRFGATATTAAWESDGDWVDGLLHHLSAMRSKVSERLAAEAPSVVLHDPDATFLAWLNVEGCGLGDTPADHLLERARVAVGEGSMFGTGGRNHIRLNFATSAEILDEILDRLIPHLHG